MYGYRPRFGGCACVQLLNSAHLTASKPMKRENATEIAWRFSSEQYSIGCNWEPISKLARIGPRAVVFLCNPACFPWISGNLLNNAGEQAATGASLPVHLG